MRMVAQPQKEGNAQKGDNDGQINPREHLFSFEF
jgi:hypothetical protein